MTEEITERVTQLWPKELKDRVKAVTEKGGITDFTIEAVTKHLGISPDLDQTTKELNEVKFFAQSLADQLVLGMSSPEERLQSLMEVEFPSWIDTSGWPEAYAERVRPDALEPRAFQNGTQRVKDLVAKLEAEAPQPVVQPEPEVVSDAAPEIVPAKPLPADLAPLAAKQDKKVEPEPEPFVPADKGPRDDLFSRVMAKAGGKLDDVPGLQLASEIPKPPPVVQKDLCGKCGEELVDGECWTCA